MEHIIIIYVYVYTKTYIHDNDNDNDNDNNNNNNNNNNFNKFATILNNSNRWIQKKICSEVYICKLSYTETIVGGGLGKCVVQWMKR